MFLPSSFTLAPNDQIKAKANHFSKRPTYKSSFLLFSKDKALSYFYKESNNLQNPITTAVFEISINSLQFYLALITLGIHFSIKSCKVSLKNSSLYYSTQDYT